MNPSILPSSRRPRYNVPPRELDIIFWMLFTYQEEPLSSATYLIPCWASRRRSWTRTFLWPCRRPACTWGWSHRRETSCTMLITVIKSVSLTKLVLLWFQGRTEVDSKWETCCSAYRFDMRLVPVALELGAGSFVPGHHGVPHVMAHLLEAKNVVVSRGCHTKVIFRKKKKTSTTCIGDSHDFISDGTGLPIVSPSLIWTRHLPRPLIHL